MTETIDIGPEATRIVERLSATSRVTPVLDRARAEAALVQHMKALGIDPLPVRWVEGVREAAEHTQTESAAWRLASKAAWDAALPAAGWTHKGSPPHVCWEPPPAALKVRPHAAHAAALSALVPAVMAASAAEVQWSVAARAAESAEWLARPPAAAVDRYVAIWLPFVEAWEAGLWLFFPTPASMIAVPRPTLQIANDRLHCANGPAIEWPGGDRYWCWRGTHVTQQLIERPDEIDIREILRDAKKERELWERELRSGYYTDPGPDSFANQELRRAACERLGWERVLAAVGAREVQRDDYGVLLETDGLDDDDKCARFVRVQCPSTDREYLLRVPPDTRSAHAAVAWTFGEEAEAYAPVVQT